MNTVAIILVIILSLYFAIYIFYKYQNYRLIKRQSKKKFSLKKYLMKKKIRIAIYKNKLLYRKPKQRFSKTEIINNNVSVFMLK